MNTDERRSSDEKQEPLHPVGRTAFSGLHAETTERILEVFFEVYNELGGGFLESVYQQSMRIALMQAGIQTDVEVPVPVLFRGQLVGNYRADMVVNGRVLLELRRCPLWVVGMQDRSCTIFERRSLKLVFC